MAGIIHVTCPAAPSVSLIAGGQKVRVLVVITRAVTALAPGVPTVAEALPGYELNGCYGMLAPPGTLKPITTRLNQEFTRVVYEPATRERLFGVGVEATPSTPETFSAFLKKEHERWAKLLKEAGIKATS